MEPREEEMDLRAVVVFSNWTGRGDDIVTRHNGIRFGNWVITYGGPTLNNGLDQISQNVLLRCLSTRYMIDYNIPATFSCTMESNEGEEEQDQNPESKYIEMGANLVFMWDCPFISKCFRTKLSSCHFEFPSQTNTMKCVEVPELFNIFLLLKIGEVPSKYEINQVLNQMVDLVTVDSLERGMDILVESTPFVMKTFFNSWSKGIIGNMFGDDKSILLLDTNLTVGSEGAPIYLLKPEDNKKCVGMVLFSVLSIKGEAIALSLGVKLNSVLNHSISEYQDNSPHGSLINSTLGPVSDDTGIVLVRCGEFWGTGCLISWNGIIITCAHVIKMYVERNDCIIVYYNGTAHMAEHIFHTIKESVYDIALVRIGRIGVLKPFRFAKEAPVKGEQIFSIGHCFFSEAFKPYTPTISSGIVAKTFGFGGPMQTTCIIYTGASGGAIIRPNGELLAIIVCNTIDNFTHLCIPKLNFGLPVIAFGAIITEFLQTRNISKLNELNRKDSKLKLIWELKSHL